MVDVDVVDGVEGAWVNVGSTELFADPDWNRGHWRFIGAFETYTNGVVDSGRIAPHWEKFVPVKPKLSKLPVGSIVGLTESGGGVYIHTRTGWKYVSVMFTDFVDGVPDSAVTDMYVIREGE